MSRVADAVGEQLHRLDEGLVQDLRKQGLQDAEDTMGTPDALYERATREAVTGKCTLNA